MGIPNIMNLGYPQTDDNPFPSDRLLPADVALVFGMNSPERPARHAINLWRQGYVSRLLFTGGFNDRLGAVEAEVMAETARQAHIPEEAILIEPCARNTDQNAEFTAQLLAQSPSPPRLLIVTVHYHLRRARLAVARWHGPHSVCGWSCYTSRHYTAEDWCQSARAQQDVANETSKIRRYYPVEELVS